MGDVDNSGGTIYYNDNVVQEKQTNKQKDKLTINKSWCFYYSTCTHAVAPLKSVNFKPHLGKVHFTIVGHEKFGFRIAQINYIFVRFVNICLITTGTSGILKFFTFL